MYELLRACSTVLLQACGESGGALMLRRDSKNQKSHALACYFLHGAEGVEYYDLGAYGCLHLPDFVVYIESQGALDALREALREKRDE